MSGRTARPSVRIAWLSAVLVPILVLLGVSGGGAAPPEPEDMVAGIVRLPAEAFSMPHLARADKGDPKLDTAMNALLRAAQVSGQEALDAARDLSLRTLDGRVQAQVVVAAGTWQATAKAIAASGGEVTSVTRDDTLIQCWLTVSSLANLAARPEVHVIRRPVQAVLLERLQVGSSTSEGVAAMNADAWHSAGETGSGVKVAIIDGGFEGYATLLGSDLPASVTAYNFVDGESQAELDGTTEHGTACAEVVHDVAPGAALYLAKIDTDADLEEAVAWARDTHNVDVISTSLGWYNATPGDGTGQFANLVQSARDAGILWATAAGNDRESHWGGPYADVDGDDYHEFAGKEINCFGPDPESCWNINPGFQIVAFLRWNDWSAVTQDYDLYIVKYTGSGWDIVGVSGEGTQDGSPGQTPTEVAYTVTDGAATAYGVVIARHDATTAVNFELFVPKFAPLAQLLHARSLANLADSPAAMTVAALDSSIPYPQESYSSEGPTNGPGGAEMGGAIKPDISGYANVATQSYGGSLFNGTSAATPHVAGAAALVLGMQPSYTPAQVQDALEGWAIDMGSAGKDTVYGHGRLYLEPVSTTAPVVTSIVPATGVNTDTVSVELTGLNYAAGATVALEKAGQAAIPGTGVTVVSTQTITCQFDLTGAARGMWDVRVTNTNMETGVLPAGFEVTGEGGGGPVYLPLVLAKYPLPPGMLYPYGDATVLSARGSTNFGSTTDMWVGYDHCYDLGKARSLIRFDLSDVPAGYPLSKATLRLYLYDGCDMSNRSHAVKVYRIKSSWSSGSVTWNNQPAHDTSKVWASTNVPSWTPGWYSWDITALVKAWLSGQYPNYGVVLRASEASDTSSASKFFYTMNKSGTTYDPRLVFTWTGLSGTGEAIVGEVSEMDGDGLTIEAVLGIAPGSCVEQGFTIDNIGPRE
ncbi:MAG: DNRLRE domain-containing protein [Anaerolineae bacterium]|nr:DNRLRE domain-containing protein [Anaerolineae bacterium]